MLKKVMRLFTPDELIFFMLMIVLLIIAEVFL